ncbi:hypothetical protein M6B38_331690 [Iris pallida]|uniref:Uncharacterized protein n=1 Tax=Iris pallida TaxID=29817 RepID=A0AAX6H4Q3_IRIPA|nr:hypothetical protein M6B38_331690 [Iris pallida]
MPCSFSGGITISGPASSVSSTANSLHRRADRLPRLPDDEQQQPDVMPSSDDDEERHRLGSIPARGFLLPDGDVRKNSPATPSFDDFAVSNLCRQTEIRCEVALSDLPLQRI